MTGFLDALGFLTVLGGPRPLSTAAPRWFPAVGALVGLAVGAVWWGAAQVLPAAPAAVVAIAADLLLTGLLHVDGLADSADGLLAPMDRARRLKVMREPTVGAFAVVVTVLVLLARWSGLAELEPTPLLLVGLWTASRSLAVVALDRLPLARPDGLATTFAGRGDTVVGVLGVVSGVALAAVWEPVYGPLAALVGLGAAVGVLALSVRRLGGITGDTLGAAIVVLETVALLTATAMLSG